MPMLVRVEQVETKLTAITLLRSECFDDGDHVWRGTLPHAPILRSELPITFEVELAVVPSKPSVKGTGAVVSSDSMLLTVGTMPLVLRRVEAAVDEPDVSLGIATDSGVEAGARDGGVQRDASHDAAIPEVSDSGTGRQGEQVRRAGAGGPADSGGAGASSPQGAAAANPVTSSRDWYCLS